MKANKQLTKLEIIEQSFHNNGSSSLKIVYNEREVMGLERPTDTCSIGML